MKVCVKLEIECVVCLRNSNMLFLVLCLKIIVLIFVVKSLVLKPEMYLCFDMMGQHSLI